MIEIFIPGHVPSKKNSKRIVTYGKYPKLLNSKAVEEYMNTRSGFFLAHKVKIRNALKKMKKPYHAYFYFHRKTAHSFDFNNANHLITDMMVSHGWIEDDTCDIILPIPLIKDNTCYKVDKYNPGVLLKIK